MSTRTIRYRVVTAFERNEDGYGARAIWAGFQYEDVDPGIPDDIQKRMGFLEYGSWITHEGA